MKQDFGPGPFVTNIQEQTLQNTNYRTTLWTGPSLQLTLMSIPVGGEIGLEVHPDNDQFLRLEQGHARVQMGPAQDDLSFDKTIQDDWSVFVPAGTWHNITNIGDEDLKVYSIYSPKHHQPGTVHATKAVADAAEAAE